MKVDGVNSHNELVTRVSRDQSTFLEHMKMKLVCNATMEQVEGRKGMNKTKKTVLKQIGDMAWWSM